MNIGLQIYQKNFRAINFPFGISDSVSDVQKMLQPAVYGSNGLKITILFLFASE